MEPTVKISIGGLAFNLEEDAYLELDNYLKSLRKHFLGNIEADEIIEDIETRLSELLQMRMGGNDGVVSIEDAKEIIKIMGNPKDFDTNIADPEFTNRNYKEKEFYERETTYKTFHKKLYRDIDNNIIGGVCSGLSHYFRIDPTAIRLLFSGVFLLLFFSIHSSPVCTSILLVYIVLWIVIPPAKSFKQRLEMTGSDPSIENIEDRTQSSAKRYKGSAITTILNVIINIFAGLIALATALSLIGIIATLIWLYLDTDIIGLTNYLILVGYNTWYFKIAVVIVSILPVIALLCLMIKILRRSPFTSQSLIIFIIGLVIWAGAGVYLGNKGFKFAHSHRFSEEVIEQVAITTQSDNLYIQLDNIYTEAESLPHNPYLFYRGKSLNDREVSILPEVKIKEDSTLSDYKVEIYKKDYNGSRASAKRKAEMLHLNYTVSDSLITIKPLWYDNRNHWNAETFEIVVTTPKYKRVILDALLKDTRKNYYLPFSTVGLSFKVN